jgi:hypothetical protein
VTIEESLKRLLARSLEKHGENAFSTRQLRQQLASLEADRRAARKAQGLQKFHLGARQGQPEDGDRLEDMYGNRIPSELERAEVEVEEEKRQQEECANRARRRP